MPRAHVLLNENIHESADDAFARAGIRVYRNKGGLAGEALVAALLAIPGDEPVLLGVRSKTQVRKAVLDAVPRLAAVGAFCIGTDQVDLDRARQLGIAVFNAPFSNTRSVAELVIAEIVILSRQIFARSMAAHQGRWLKDADGSHEVRGKRLGIVGYGHIGSQLSILAEALGMRVSYYDVVNKLPLGNAVATEDLDTLLRTSDFVTLHVPDTEQTRGMMGATQLATLKRGAYLINASRGTVVDIDALAAAIDSGHVAGAAIDVYPKEPDSAGDRFESPLQNKPSVILTPHIGGSTQEAQANIGREVSEALSAYMTLGRTTSCLTLPAIDASELRGGSCRLVNVHDDVPGVLSMVNTVVAQVGVNITGQHLVTGGGRGMLLMDIALPRSDARANALLDGIAKLDHSLRTQLLG